MTTSTNEDVRDIAYSKPVYVFEAPVRVWHWVQALSIVVLAATGYLIANPLPSVGGEASDHFMMGNIRMIHFIAAYVFAIGFAVRIYWAFVGNSYSREIFYLPFWRIAWWRELVHELKSYLFLTSEIHKIPGHNPLAQTAMFLLNTLLGLFMIFTGFALYSEGLGQGSWADRLFGWVIPLLGGSESVHNLHDLGMWLMITFVIIHVYMAMRADVITRQSSVSTMIGGWRLFKDDRP
ncbi:MAG: Ni/Fe-hydrogenase, b-type cytochrome subunit [Gammaproteobacteria bacterium]|jgi:Ni/Fe-hydrogenase 1 B-type cytochrome subunit|nr:Ni/Fe-hydrogenase, b-type cytochrome subunit [Gammaproteobacteria bacterium]